MIKIQIKGVRYILHASWNPPLSSRDPSRAGGPLESWPKVWHHTDWKCYSKHIKRHWLHQNQIIELNLYFWSTIVKYTSFYLVILLIKIQGVLLLKIRTRAPADILEYCWYSLIFYADAAAVCKSPLYMLIFSKIQ